MVCVRHPVPNLRREIQYTDAKVQFTENGLLVDIRTIRPIERGWLVSCDRFASYDESDLWWAIPLGLAKIDDSWVRYGDVIKSDSLFTDIQGAKLFCSHSELCDVASAVPEYAYRFEQSS